MAKSPDAHLCAFGDRYDDERVHVGVAIGEEAVAYDLGRPVDAHRVDQLGWKRPRRTLAVTREIEVLDTPVLALEAVSSHRMRVEILVPGPPEAAAGSQP
jgi:hypothetical protein